MTKITTMVIGIILGSLFVTLIAIFMGHASQEYSLTYDNTSLEVYNKLDAIANTTRSVKEQVEEIEERSGIIDVVGGWVSDGIQALRLTANSITTFESMSNSAIDHLAIGESGRYIRVAITAIVLILVFVGVIISALVGKPQL